MWMKVIKIDNRKINLTIETVINQVKWKKGIFIVDPKF